MPEYTPDRAEVDVLAAEIRVMAARYPELNTARGVALDILGSRWLAARDRENRAIGWDEARERFNDDNYRQGCICLNADHRREHPAMHWLNPYRGDTT